MKNTYTDPDWVSKTALWIGNMKPKKQSKHVTSPEWENRFRYVQELRQDAYARIAQLEAELARYQRIAAWIGITASVAFMSIIFVVFFLVVW